MVKGKIPRGAGDGGRNLYFVLAETLRDGRLVDGIWSMVRVSYLCGSGKAFK